MSLRNMILILLLNMGLMVAFGDEHGTNEEDILGIRVFTAGHSDEDSLEFFTFMIDVESNLRPVKEMSLCMWVKPFRFNFATVLFYFTPYTEFEEYFSLMMYYETIAGKFPPSNSVKLLAYEWQHLCTLFRENVSLHLQGKETIIDTRTLLIVEDKLLFSLGTDSLVENPFSGLVADIRLYFRILDEKEIMQIATLADTETDYTLIGRKQLIDNLSMHARETDEKLFFMKKEDFMKNQSDVNLFYDDNFYDCESTKEMCEVLGGHIPFFDSFDDLEPLAKLIREFSISHDKKIDTFWLLKMENGTTICYKAYPEINEGTLQVKNLENEKKKKLKLICVLHKLQRFYFKTDDDTLEFSLVPNSNLEFEDLRQGVRLTWNELIANTTSLDKKYSFYSRYLEHRPGNMFGRKKWKTDLGKDVTVTFSICSNTEFSCTSGLCIDLNKICDFTMDCRDGSDEFFCDVGVAPHHTYDKRLAPTSDGHNNFNVSLEIDLENVLEISMEKESITLSLNMIAKWIDPRLHFKNLVSNHSRYVGKHIVRKIWHPPIILKEIFGRRFYLFYMPDNSGRVSASRMEEGRIRFLLAHEVYINKGDKVQLSHEINNIIEFSCQMNLFLFPFDDQTCSLNVELDGIIHQDVEWAPNPIVRQKTTNLPLYSNLKLTAFTNAERPEQIVLSLYFKRKNGSYVFTIYLPCFILEAIGLLTLLMPCESYSDRVTVTLADLIVMAALFTQVSASLPKSPDPKMIDYWMFTHVCSLFFIFLIHIIIIHLHHNHNKFKDKVKDEHTKEILKMYSSVEPKACWNSEKEEQTTTKKEPMPAHTKVNNFGLIFSIACYIILIIIFTT